MTKKRCNISVFNVLTIVLLIKIVIILFFDCVASSVIVPYDVLIKTGDLHVWMSSHLFLCKLFTGCKHPNLFRVLCSLCTKVLLWD